MQIAQSRTLAMLFLGACLTIFSGCQQSTAKETYPVSGTVTLDGSPMSDGDVFFKDEASAKFASFPVSNGQFSGQSQAGTFKVEIMAYRDETPKTDKTGYMPPEGGSSKVNYLPAKYNTNSTETAEVKESGTNEFKFEVTSK